MPSVTRNIEAHTTTGTTTIIINDGTDDITIDNVLPDSYDFLPPWVGRVKYRNGDTPQVPIAGDLDEAVLKFNANAGLWTEAKGILALALAAAATGNEVRTYTVTIKKAGYKGSAAGEQIVMVKAWFEVAPRYKGGKPSTIDGIELHCCPGDYSASTY